MASGAKEQNFSTKMTAIDPKRTQQYMTRISLKNFLVGFLSTLFVLAIPLHADDQTGYKPLFSVHMPFGPSAKGNVVTDYMAATGSTTITEAKKRWEKFSEDHSGTDYEDLTDLTLFRQAAFELARIYYLLGDKAKGDKEMMKAYSIVAYDIPDEDKARQWCRSSKYCDINLPESLRNAPFKSAPENN